MHWMALAVTSLLGAGARPYDVQHYRVEVRLHPDGTFDNAVSIKLKAAKALTSLELDSFGLKVSSATVDGTKAGVATAVLASHEGGTLTLKPPHPLAAGKETTVEIHYSGKANSDAFGFSQVKDPDAPESLAYYFTHFEPNGAQRFFPCNDDPGDKATLEWVAVVDARYQVFANGKKALDEPFTDKEEHLRRVQWVESKPISTSRAALAVGQFEDVDVGADVPAALHLPPHFAPLAFAAAEGTRGALESEGAFLGVKYPWDKYDQVGIPLYFGGMENTSLTFLRAEGYLAQGAKNDVYTRQFRFEAIARALAHQWLGDFVTGRTWNDTWLLEGLAQHVATKATAAYLETDAAAVAAAEDTFVDYFQQEASAATHPEDAFEPRAYKRGAPVARMLETLLGTEDFRKALASYLNAHAYGNASALDFFDALAANTKKKAEVRAMRDSWLLKKGYPSIAPRVEWAGGTATVTVSQKGAFAFPLQIVLHRE